MRCDMPNDPEFGRCSIHQDGVYARGSLNSVTAWIPLQDVVPAAVSGWFRRHTPMGYFQIVAGL